MNSQQVTPKRELVETPIFKQSVTELDADFIFWELIRQEANERFEQAIRRVQAVG
jgi:hypothetical protein